MSSLPVILEATPKLSIIHQLLVMNTVALILCVVEGENRSVSWNCDECCAYHVLVLLVSPVGSVLTDPGPLCAGRTVVLNCTGGQGHDWRYDMSRGVIINILAPPPGTS